MVEYTIDDIRGPTVAREMAQLKEFVLAKFNGMIFHYEHRFGLYDDNAAKLKEYSEIVNRETGNTDKFLDTPGHNVTIGDNYLTNVREITGTDKITDPKGTVVEAMNRLMDELRDLEEEFVDEFDECFISLYLP